MTREEHLSKALDLMIEWAVDCGFSFENIPEEFELYEHDIEEQGMRHNEGIRYIVMKESAETEDQDGQTSN